MSIYFSVSTCILTNIVGTSFCVNSVSLSRVYTLLLLHFMGLDVCSTTVSFITKSFKGINICSLALIYGMVSFDYGVIIFDGQ